MMSNRIMQRAGKLASLIMWETGKKAVHGFFASCALFFMHTAMPYANIIFRQGKAAYSIISSTALFLFLAEAADRMVLMD